MVTENFANNAVTTLSSGITDADVSIPLTSGAAFSLGRHRILIDSEIIIITSRSSNTLTVEERGAEGTTAAAHLSGATVAQIPTAESLNSLRLSVDTLIEAAGGTAGVFKLYGGEVTRGAGDLELDVTAGAIDFQGQVVAFDATTVELSAGDETNSRFDSLIVTKSTGLVTVEEGDPAADPLIPQTDPTTQYVLSTRLIPANTTDLDDVVERETVYAEGSEWPETTNNGNGTVTGESTDDAHAGTKSVKFDACSTTANRVDFVRASDLVISGKDKLVFWIKPTVSANWATMALWLSFRTSNQQQVGNIITLRDGERGFDASSNTWQKIVITLDAFNVLGKTVRRLRLFTNGSAVVSFFLDDVELQGGLEAQPNGLTAVVEDTSPELGGDLEANGHAISEAKVITFNSEVDNGNSSTADTIDWGAGQKQKSTLTDNCTFTFTAPAGPCNLLLKLVQDGTGSRTVTWPASVKWPSGTAPTLTSTGSAVDIVTFYWDGTNYHGVASLAFAVPA